jgi:colanic acid/amylovoran biosynthesis glycosyltransferase
VSGWLVPAGAVLPLVDAMAELLSADGAELNQMGQSGRVRVAEWHDARNEAARLAELFSNPLLTANLPVENGLAANLVTAR